MSKRRRVVVSCEHAGNDVPTKYQALFSGRAARRALSSHRGWDPGSIELGRRIADVLHAPLIVNRWSRLLVEVNRSMGHPRLYSEFSRSLTATERRHLLDNVYQPHRDRVEAEVRMALQSGAEVVHIGAHTFVPKLDGETRNADVGLLYDPRRPAEAAFCRRWQLSLQRLSPTLRMRRNYPYLGRADGLTTHLRRALKTPRYLGIELELNQALLGLTGRGGWRCTLGAIVESLREMLDL